jgi:DNA-binding transcriptional ArsR family regulator
MANIMASSDVFRAVADPTRRAVLELLREAELSATELAEPFRISQPAISQHLRVLREAGLVRVEKIGRHRKYKLNPEPLRAIDDWIGHYRRFWSRRLERLGRILDEME